MAHPRRLSHPPIQEATIDFHLAGATSVDADTLAHIAESIAQSDWRTSKLNQFRAALGLSATEASGGGFSLKELTRSFEGYMIQDPSGEVVIQIRPDRVTASHVKKYTTWEELVAVGITSLQKHVEFSRASKIDRIGARYINRLSLPSPDFYAFQEILSNPPKPLDGAKGGILTDFTLDEVIRRLGTGWDAKVRIGTVVPLPGETQNGLLVDVDVFKTVDMEPVIAQDDSILIEARRLKNDLFFGALTEEALEVYQ